MTRTAPHPPASRLLALALMCAALAACQAPTASTPGDDPAGTPAAADATVTVSTLSDTLAHPWAMAFLPDGGFLITERPGRLRILSADGELSKPLDGVPEVLAEGQGGLLDVALSPDFARDRWIYLSYAEPGDGGLAGTAVARARLQGKGLLDLQVLFRQQPKVETRHHYGSRLVFDRDGHLFITLGERGQNSMAQALDNHLGKVLRLNLDGSMPIDNPFVGIDQALPEIWSFGHRNPQGAALNPWTGAVWTHEHGPKGGDEINIPQAGHNYGWPIITHGIDYSGRPIAESVGREQPGMQQPHHVWPVSPGISGMAFYDHPRFPAWQHSLFIGSLAQRALLRLSLDGDRVIAEQRLLEDLRWRIRDVRVGPDGAVYLLTDEDRGRLLRVELSPP